MSITKNIKTDYGAVGNGKRAATNLTIASGSPNLSTSGAIFSNGDVGSVIIIPKAGASGNPLSTSILTFTDSSHVVLAANAGTSISAQSHIIYWGTDDSTKFANFQTDALADGTATLTIPSGIYLIPSAGGFWVGISNITINMSDATLNEFSRGGSFFQTAGTSARILETVIGASSVFLKTISDNSFFHVNDWIALTSQEMQGDGGVSGTGGGYPPNWYNCEYHQIVSINTGTGEIALDSPIKFRHLSFLPSTSNSTYDTGGPASIFNMHQNWNQVLTVNGGTIGGGSQSQLIGKNLTFNNVVFEPTDGTDPSNSKDIVFSSCSLGFIEADKDIENLTFTNCTISQLLQQSASINYLLVDGGSIDFVNGTAAHNCTFRNSTITTMIIGPVGYGASKSLEITNCVVSNNPATTIGGVFVNLSDFSFSNGRFSTPISGGNNGELFKFAVTGANVFFNGTGSGGPPNFGNPMRITSVGTDGINNFFGNSALSQLPVYSGAGSPTATKIVTHPCPSLTVRGSTGCSDIVDFSQALGNRPIYEYSRRTYIGNIGHSSPGANVWGKLVFIKINVTTAYVGSSSTLLVHIANQFGTFVMDDANVATQWDIVIDLKTAGLRTITPSAVTGSVGADSIPTVASFATGNVWFTSGLTPYLGTDISSGTTAMPVFTVEIQANQGLPLAAPLQMRLHA